MISTLKHLCSAETPRSHHLESEKIPFKVYLIPEKKRLVALIVLGKTINTNLQNNSSYNNKGFTPVLIKETDKLATVMS